MTKLYASPSRVVIYTDGDTSPETANPPDLTRIKFDTNLEYTRVIRTATVNVTLPQRNSQTSGNQDPAVFQNYILETHGLGYTPLVFGYLIKGASQHVPLRGSVPLQRDTNSATVSDWARFVSLGSSPTQVILNEYSVRRFVSNNTVVYAEITVPVTYFITNVSLD